MLSYKVSYLIRNRHTYEMTWSSLCENGHVVTWALYILKLTTLIDHVITNVQYDSQKLYHFLGNSADCIFIRFSAISADFLNFLQISSDFCRISAEFLWTSAEFPQISAEYSRTAADVKCYQFPQMP